MKLTQFTDYGLRALMILGSHQQHSFSSKELADILHISREHLVKVLQRLSQGGYVRSQRGAGGGFRLFMDAKEIPIGHLVRWLEEGQGLVECLRHEGGHCNLTPLCLLRPMLEEASAAFYARLNAYTLADCVHPPLERFTQRWRETLPSFLSKREGPMETVETGQPDGEDRVSQPPVSRN